MNTNYLNFILDQLSDVDGITILKKLGGVRFYRSGMLFGVIIGGKFRIRKHPCHCTDDHLPSQTTTQFLEETSEGDNIVWCTVPEHILQNQEIFTRLVRIVTETSEEENHRQESCL